MKCNLGQVDKVVRLIIGVVIVAAGFYTRHFEHYYGLVFWTAGLWLLVTALFSWCPFYGLMHFSTRKPTPSATTSVSAPTETA